jgi:hypothetical protein
MAASNLPGENLNNQRQGHSWPANFIIKLCQSMWVSALTTFNFPGNLINTSLSQRFCSFKSYGK